MLKSMTGYGKSEFLDNNYDLFFEIKSVNHKFLDIQIRMPYFLNFCEDSIKNLIKSKISRGRIDIFIRGSQTFTEENSIMKVNYSLAKAYYDSYNKLSEFLGIENSVSLGHIIKNENVIEIKNEDINEDYLKCNVLKSIEKAMDELISMRISEGENLKEFFVNSLNVIEENVEAIKVESPTVLNNQIEKLRGKLKEFCGELSESEINRLNTEVIFYTDKLDISEEIIRLGSHLKTFRKYLESKEPIGKKFEFLLQEINREINTIGSKSCNYAIANYVVEIKITIEKIREQIQNIE